jgi:hypothetical protein
MIWVDSVCDLLAYMLVNYAGSPRFSNPAGWEECWNSVWVELLLNSILHLKVLSYH